MVYCAKCKTPNEDTSKYCSKCGSKLMAYKRKSNINPNLKICKDCNGTVSKNADKCPHCGAKLKETPVDHIVYFIIAVIIVVAFFVFFY